MDRPTPSRYLIGNWRNRVLPENKKLSGIVEDLAIKHFGAAKLGRVELRADTDFEGDTILRVMVVLKMLEHTSSDSLVKFQRDVVNKLREETDLFPLVSFRSVQDDEDIKSEAA